MLLSKWIMYSLVKCKISFEECNWGVKPCEVMMVGDSAPDDIVCGNRAGAITCLLDNLERYQMHELPRDQNLYMHGHKEGRGFYLIQQVGNTLIFPT